MIPQVNDTPEENGRDSNTALANRNTPSLLSLNLDWLTVSVSEPLPEHLYEYLSLLAADVSHDVPAIETHLTYREELLLLSRSHDGELILKNDYLRICIYPERLRSMGYPYAQIVLYSPCFWSAGVGHALSELQQFADDLWSFHLLPLRASRVDISLDVANYSMPTLSEYPAFLRSWVRRSKVSRPYINDEAVETLYLGSAKAPCKLRMYNKSLEMEKHGKDYYLPMWRDAGYTDGSLVTRFEWQLGSSFLREWVSDAGERIETLESLLRLLPAIYRYLTCSWARLVTPSETDKDRDRWPVTEFWLLVQSARFAFARVVVAAERRGERRVQLEKIKAQMFGCLKTVLALVPGGSDYDLTEITNGLYRMMVDYEADRCEAFSSAVFRRRMELAKVA